jgi:small neutral amino acid transporter SnatA (MarC family)
MSMPKESPMSEALNWFSRILAVGVVMLALGWCGGQLDQWLGTKFIAVIGFLVGMTIGLIALIGILQRSNLKK